MTRAAFRGRPLLGEKSASALRNAPIAPAFGRDPIGFKFLAWDRQARISHQATPVCSQVRLCSPSKTVSFAP